MSNTPQTSAPDAAAHPINAKAIFIWLAALTIFEVLVTYIPLPQASIATLLVVSSLG